MGRSIAKIICIPYLKPHFQSFASMEKYIDDEELKEMFHQKTSNMTEEEKMMLVPIDMIRQATKIGLGLTGHNTTDFDGKNLKVMSPRFMSILPEDKEGKGNEVSVIYKVSEI